MTVYQATSAPEVVALRQSHEINLRMGNVITAAEAMLLDPFGQFLEMPVAELLGAGWQRDSAPVLMYLFYMGDRCRTDLPYLDGVNITDN